MNSGTIKEIAALAGVSTATVSRAINKPHSVAAETRERILEIVRNSGFSPNHAASSLRTDKTMLILALVPEISSPFYGAVLREMDIVANEAGYSLLLGNLNRDGKRHGDFLQVLNSRRVDGIISFGGRIDAEINSRTPIVRVGLESTSDPIATVDIDHHEAMCAVVRHLLELGHKKIACIAGPPGAFSSEQRIQAYRDVFAEAGITARDEWIIPAYYSGELAFDATQKLLQLKECPTAIACLNDAMAIGAMAQLRKSGLRIPEDISVTGFDDLTLAQFAVPPLTTVAQPIAELGRTALDLLFQIMSGNDLRHTRKILPAKIIIRQSTARLTTEN